MKILNLRIQEIIDLLNLYSSKGYSHVDVELIIEGQEGTLTFFASKGVTYKEIPKSAKTLTPTNRRIDYLNKLSI